MYKKIYKKIRKYAYNIRKIKNWRKKPASLGYESLLEKYSLWYSSI